MLTRTRTKFCYTKNVWEPSQRNSYFRTQLSLFLTSKQLYKEALHVFLSTNHIIIYSYYHPKPPSPLFLDDHWFTAHPLPMRKLTMKGTGGGNPKMVASCPNLRFLAITTSAHKFCIKEATDQRRDAWLLQYKTNLARLLSHADGTIELKGSSLRYKEVDPYRTFTLVGCGTPVHTEKVVDLLEEARVACVDVADIKERIMYRRSLEAEMKGWGIRLGCDPKGNATVKLLRRIEEGVQGKCAS